MAVLSCVLYILVLSDISEQKIFLDTHAYTSFHELYSVIYPEGFLWQRKHLKNPKLLNLHLNERIFVDFHHKDLEYRRKGHCPHSQVIKCVYDNCGSLREL